jgi:hypothetical protein
MRIASRSPYISVDDEGDQVGASPGPAGGEALTIDRPGVVKTSIVRTAGACEVPSEVMISPVSTVNGQWTSATSREMAHKSRSPQEDDRHPYLR